MLLLVPMQPLAFKYAHVAHTAISYSPVIWIVNIQPVREILSNNYGCTNSTLDGFCLLYGIIPWRSTVKASRTVLPAASAHRSPVHSQICSDAYLGTPLDDIMNFLPLREAFGEFCRKALCSELSSTVDYKAALN
ncbi:unnamed protein product [Ectocarpus sp. CCAP 1310/34]|nr:unnamed protein product [Ectocarpus sp. CCAP 1310/34]